MNADLITRLREAALEGIWDFTQASFDMQNAADEIERLEKLVTTWIICAERLVESQEGKQYEKAMAFYRDCQRIANETC